MNVKPMLFVNEDLSEGVYAASGSPATGEVSYRLELYGNMTGRKNYYIYFTNNSDRKINSVTVMLKAHGVITGFDGAVTGVLEGDKVRVEFSRFTNGIEANATVGPYIMQVLGEGDFSVE